MTKHEREILKWQAAHARLLCIAFTLNNKFGKTNEFTKHAMLNRMLIDYRNPMVDGLIREARDIAHKVKEEA